MRVGCALAAAISAGALVLVGTVNPAHAQSSTTATISRVVDGDTVEALLADGTTLTVRLIGIDTPERGECGTDEATDYMEQLALGRTVSLVGDPSQDSVDRFGRSLFYVDRNDDGVDVGQEMIRGGWAEVFVFDQDFQRLPAYRNVGEEAEGFERGVWARCGGDFHRSRSDELRDRRRAAVAFTRRYYRRVSKRQFLTAWSMLGRPVRRRFGTLSEWKAGHRRSLGVSVMAASARLSGRRAVVSVRLRSRDRDACTGRVIRQYFRGSWTLAPRGEGWVFVNVHVRKTRGGKVRLSKADCPRTEPAPSPPPVNCQGYSPCLPPGSDVDCRGGEGNGPRYVDGPVYVTGSDPYDLDGNDDGVGCE